MDEWNNLFFPVKVSHNKVMVSENPSPLCRGPLILTNISPGLRIAICNNAFLVGAAARSDTRLTGLSGLSCFFEVDVFINSWKPKIIQKSFITLFSIWVISRYLRIEYSWNKHLQLFVLSILFPLHVIIYYLEHMQNKSTNGREWSLENRCGWPHLAPYTHTHTLPLNVNLTLNVINKIDFPTAPSCLLFVSSAYARKDKKAATL